MQVNGRPLVAMYAFRSTDPVRLARFWGRLMDLPLAAGASDQLAMLDFDQQHGPVTWMFEPTTGLEGQGRGWLGLDLTTGQESEWMAVADRAETLGAVRVSHHDEDGIRWIEMRDPDGNPFRVFAPRAQG